MGKEIVIKGARENNLKNIDVVIPKDKLVVMTGLSGCGKTSLAFDTIFAEGQRRYVGSLSAYARQFLGNTEKPDVDSIEGLSPSISVDQRTTVKNPRSTVGTVTEIYDYLRLLYARIGHPRCPVHHVEIASQTITQMTDKISEYPEGSKLIIYGPIVFGEKGTHEKTISLLRRDGFSKVRIDGEIFDLSENEIKLDKNVKHNIDVVIDRIRIRHEARSRIYASLETALRYGDGKIRIDVEGNEQIFSEKFACPYCDFSIPRLEPRLFSFNSPFGACPVCHGLGFLKQVDSALLVPDPDLSINQGAIRYYRNFQDTDNLEWQTFEVLLNHYHVDRDLPFKDLSPKIKNIIFNGSDEPIDYELVSSGLQIRRQTRYIEGIAALILRRYNETRSSVAREYYNSYLREDVCPRCGGKRLSREALSVYVGDRNIFEFTEMTVYDASRFIDELNPSHSERIIADLILKEIQSRFRFLIEVGLDYLTLSRAAGTLSGGEAQRIRLATQIGSRLTGVLYVLDEPSIGLHQRDNDRLITALKEMRDLGNTIIVVEHDEEIMRRADYLIDIGPGAGDNGGEIVAVGTAEEICNSPRSITGAYLSGRKFIPVPERRRSGNGKDILIKGARENNLKSIDVVIKGGCLNVVTGVSGSGKSTLINEILYKYLARKINKARVMPGKYDEIHGAENFERVIDINQQPIGRTPRSNPATYTGVFGYIRDLFASTVEAKIRGYNKGRFSFNLKGGRCERCCGDGLIRIEMNFLPDVYIPCEECRGTRYNEETLEVKYKGKSIADILGMTAETAYEFFSGFPVIRQRLKTMCDVGLGYIKLGQSATALSGGEAQRVKLASELYKKVGDKTIYLLDEPTTGLHTDDIGRLLKTIDYIVDCGATVVIIEHNLDVIKRADYIIDLGPEGGERGGELIACGTPEAVMKNERSYTGAYLRKVLKCS